MKKYIIGKKSDAKITIPITVTQLQSILYPNRYKIDNIREREFTFGIGAYIEKVVQGTMNNGIGYGLSVADIQRGKMENDLSFYIESLNNDKLNQYRWLLEQKKNKDGVILDNGFEAIPFLIESEGDLIKENGYNLINDRTIVEIYIDEFCFIFSGEVDIGVDKKKLFDIKTSKNKSSWLNSNYVSDKESKEEVRNYQFQSYFYPLFNLLTNYSDLNTIENLGDEKIDFEYLIFIKNKKMLLERINYEVSFQEASLFVEKKLREFIRRVKLPENDIDKIKLVKSYQDMNRTFCDIYIGEDIKNKSVSLR